MPTSGYERLLHRLHRLQEDNARLITFQEEQRVLRRMLRTRELKPRVRLDRRRD